MRPLLLDIVPTVQQTAALALGKLANHNDDLAEAVVKGDILPQLVYSLAEQNVMTIMPCGVINNDRYGLVIFCFFYVFALLLVIPQYLVQVSFTLIYYSSYLVCYKLPR